jgi:hypothetical protein
MKSMKTKLFTALIAISLIAILALIFHSARQIDSYVAKVEAATRQARADFAGNSTGHARLLTRYSALERDRTAHRAVTTWEPNDCEREALAVLFDAETKAAAAVPLPWPLATDTARAPVLAGAVLSAHCRSALG